MHSGGRSGSFKKWAGLSAGQLKREIEDAFRGCAPGEYYALVLKVTNPISGYRVVKIPAP